MDPERFQVEIEFISLLKDIDQASRNESGPGAMNQLDRYLKKRLENQMELAGREPDNLMPRLIKD